jgi:hypothetical protein
MLVNPIVISPSTIERLSTRMPTTLFDIALKEPRVDLWLCYLSGRLTDNDEIAQQLVGYYNEWVEVMGMNK